MSTTYTTKAGDVLDRILWRVYGTSDNIVQVMEANPGIADHGAVLPAGVVVVLPEITAAAEPAQAPVRLWG